MSPLPLPVLLQAARTIVRESYDAIPRLSTLDGEHWQVVAVDIENPAQHRADLPTGTSTSSVGAVLMFLEALAAALPWEAAFAPGDLATLAAQYPDGVVLDAPGDDNVAAERPLPHAMGGA